MTKEELGTNLILLGFSQKITPGFTEYRLGNIDIYLREYTFVSVWHSQDRKIFDDNNSYKDALEYVVELLDENND